MILLSLCIIAFFIGAIPSGYIIGRLRGVDLRTQGSGNIGATNAARVLGKSAGLLTLVLDTLKGVVSAAYVIRLPELLHMNSALVSGYEPIIGFFAILGHCFSPFLNWNGGKGVATGLGVFLVVCPKATLLSVLAFAAMAKGVGYVSLGSLSASLTLLLAVITNATQERSQSLVIAICGAVALIFFRHKTNLSRLMRGEESKRTERHCSTKSEYQSETK